MSVVSFPALTSTAGNNTSFHYTVCKTFLLQLQPDIAFPPAGYSIFLGDFVLLAAFFLLTFSRLPQRRKLCHMKLHRVILSARDKMKEDEKDTDSISLNVLQGVLQRNDPFEKSSYLPSTHCHLLNKHLIKCAETQSFKPVAFLKIAPRLKITPFPPTYAHTHTHTHMYTCTRFYLFPWKPLWKMFTCHHDRDNFSMKR